jgi:phosphohistidine phosphatase SixA
MKKHWKRQAFTLFCMLLAGSGVAAQPLAGQALVDALQGGGLVIVMRHANSPRELPDATSADPGNLNLERQLDAQGRNDASSFGEALRQLAIPIVAVDVSPAFRALQTARLAGFNDVTVHEQLSNEGMAATGADRAAWLQQQAVQQAALGNRLLITHGPNVAAAFPDFAEGMEEGEALVLGLSANLQSVLVARLKISEWADLTPAQ